MAEETMAEKIKRHYENHDAGYSLPEIEKMAVKVEPTLLGPAYGFSDGSWFKPAR